MRSKSEETMDRIVKSIEEFFFIHHRSPSITEIANDISCSRSTIHAYLREMNQLGRLHYDGKTLETSVTQKADADFTLSPVLVLSPAGSRNMPKKILRNMSLCR